MCAYQPQQVQEQVCVLPDQVVCLTTQVHKVMEAAGWFVSSVNDIRHVRGEHKGGAVSAQVTNRRPERQMLEQHGSTCTLNSGRPHRLMFPNICACPRNFPKSMWNMWPLLFSMMLSLWRSQIPRM